MPALLPCYMRKNISVHSRSGNTPVELCFLDRWRSGDKRPIPIWHMHGICWLRAATEMDVMHMAAVLGCMKLSELLIRFCLVGGRT